MRLKCALVRNSLATLLLCSTINIPTKIPNSLNKRAINIGDKDCYKPSGAGREL